MKGMGWPDKIKYPVKCEFWINSKYFLVHVPCSNSASGAVWVFIYSKVHMEAEPQGRTVGRPLGQDRSTRTGAHDGIGGLIRRERGTGADTCCLTVRCPLSRYDAVRGPHQGQALCSWTSQHSASGAI